jgi:hypothetical protein
MIDETQLLKTTNIRRRQGMASRANGLDLVAFGTEESVYDWLPARQAREPWLAYDLNLFIERKRNGKDGLDEGICRGGQ